MATLFGTLSVALVYYLNFKYGFSLEDPFGDFSLHEVRERDYFFIVSFSVWGLWAGMGIAALWRHISLRMRTSYRKAAPVLLLATIPLILNWPWASRAGDYSARDWAYNLLMSVEPYGVLFTNGDNDTFPLWYLQEVEGIRQDVTVIVTSYLNIDWYVHQLRDLTAPCPPDTDPGADPTRIICQRPYTPEGSPGARYVAAAEAEAVRAAGETPLLLHEPTQPPDRSIILLDDPTIDRVSQTVVPLQNDQSVELGPGVTAVLRGGTYIDPWQQFALSIIGNALGSRPVYFASSGNAAGFLGVQPYLVRQGLAFKLMEELPGSETLAGVVELAASPFTNVTGVWLDRERTRDLAWRVYLHRDGLPHEKVRWPYRAVLGIPSYYSWVHYSLYQAALEAEEEEEAQENLGEAEAWALLAG